MVKKDLPIDDLARLKTEKTAYQVQCTLLEEFNEHMCATVLEKALGDVRDWRELMMRVEVDEIMGIVTYDQLVLKGLAQQT